MDGQAKSNAKKQHSKTMDYEEGLAFAIKLHLEDMEKPDSEKDRPRRSLQALCQEAQEEMRKRKKDVTLSHVTLKRQLDGGRSCQQANEENHGWITAEEEASVVAYCLELAA